MIYPSIDKILNIVDSKYALVYIAADRSKQMTKTGYYQKELKEYKSEKNIGRALEEVYDGLIHVEKCFTSIVTQQAYIIFLTDYLINVKIIL